MFWKEGNNEGGTNTQILHKYKFLTINVCVYAGIEPTILNNSYEICGKSKIVFFLQEIVQVLQTTYSYYSMHNIISDKSEI